jgi:endonuclease/exonuclease/phosphatase family metal-dependent hydrolase
MIKILCFNIHGGYDRRGHRDLRRIHGLMQDYGIDIGVFQEIETRASRGGAVHDIQILAGPERPHHLPGLAMSEGEGWYGNLIVSRFPILRGVVHDLETKPSFEPRNAVDALLETPLGALRVIGTHLSLAPWERWSEARNLVRLMDAVGKSEKNPLLFMGDINEWRPARLARLLRHFDGLMQPLPCGPSFPSVWPLLRLDRAWCDHCSFTVRAEVIKSAEIRHLSDHLPLVLTLKSH